VRPVNPGPSLAEIDLAPATEWLADDKQIDHPGPHILGINASQMPAGDRQRRPSLGQHLTTGLIQTDLRSRWIIGMRVNIEHVFHVPGKLGISLGGDTPGLAQMRFELVCFKVWRTVSYETVSTTSKSFRQ
jgi:hypothetical protein